MDVEKRIQKIIVMLTPFCEQAKDEYQKFNDGWDAGDQKKSQVYRQKLEQFRKTQEAIYDKILPAYTKLTENDLSEIDILLAFLKINIHFFRSGYFKEDICKALKKIPLSPDYQAVVQDIILEQFSIPGREFGEFANLAICVADINFLKKVAALSNHENTFIQKRALRVLKLCASGSNVLH